MNKPRICDVLGVDVEEKFTADTPYGKFERCVIGEDGLIYNAGTNVLCYIINHPDRIIRKPRWTEQDKEDAKMIRRVFNGVQIGVARDALAQLRTIAKDGFPSEYINSDMFSSLKPGESATLDEIIGGGK